MLIKNVKIYIKKNKNLNSLKYKYIKSFCHQHYKMDIEKILKYNLSNIFLEKQNVFNELNLSKNLIQEFHKKLQYYKIIDNISQINEGKYIRWLKINTNTLTNGALVCDVEITDKDILINCKTIKNKFITVSYNKNILFEKISDDELLLINVVDNFNK